LLKHQLKNEPSLHEYRSDFVPFELEVLSPARTFFEKLLHIYTKLGTDVSQVRTRHIYDAVQIYRNFPELKEIISSGKHAEILHEAIAVSNQWYNAGLIEAEVDLHDGLQVNGEQAGILEKAYVQDAAYYYRGQPPFQNLLEELEAIRKTFARRPDLS
jgi:hypothetical protein